MNTRENAIIKNNKQQNFAFFFSEYTKVSKLYTIKSKSLGMIKQHEQPKCERKKMTLLHLVSGFSCVCVATINDRLELN